MCNPLIRTLSRLSFLSGTAAVGVATLLGQPGRTWPQPPPETAKIRLVRIPGICLAPEYVAEELLRAEGFSQVEYVPIDTLYTNDMLTANRADFTVTSAADLLPAIELGQPIVALSGLHGGCYELFTTDQVSRVRDLKGRRVAVMRAGGLSTDYFYVSSILAYVGMDPRRDVEWVEGGTFNRSMDLFVEGRADAFLAFPPQPQLLRAKKVGRSTQCLLPGELSNAPEGPYGRYRPPRFDALWLAGRTSAALRL